MSIIGIKVVYFSEEEDSNGNLIFLEKTEECLVCAETLGDAATVIEEFYGDDFIAIVHLEYLSDNECPVLIPDHTIDIIKKVN